MVDDWKITCDFPRAVTVRKNWHATPINILHQWCDDNFGVSNWDVRWNNDGNGCQYSKGQLAYYSSATFYFSTMDAAVLFELTHG